MAKKRKNKSKITQEDINRIEKSKVREDQKEQGFFDGRFRTRSEESKKAYKRKPKHPKRDDYD